MLVVLDSQTGPVGGLGSAACPQSCNRMSNTALGDSTYLVPSERGTGSELGAIQ